MKTEEVLNVDYRTEEGQQIIQKALFRIPAIQKNFFEGGTVPLEGIEKLISSICRKYAIMIQYICPTYTKGETPLYCISLKLIEPYSWLDNVYGCCLYEVMAKAAIKMYSEVKKGTAKPLIETTREKRRNDEIKNLH